MWLHRWHHLFSSRHCAIGLFRFLFSLSYCCLRRHIYMSWCFPSFTIINVTVNFRVLCWMVKLEIVELMRFFWKSCIDFAFSFASIVRIVHSVCCVCMCVFVVVDCLASIEQVWEILLWFKNWLRCCRILMTSTLHSTHLQWCLLQQWISLIMLTAIYLWSNTFINNMNKRNLTTETRLNLCIWKAWSVEEEKDKSDKTSGVYWLRCGRRNCLEVLFSAVHREWGHRRTSWEQLYRIQREKKVKAATQILFIVFQQS